MGRVFVPRPHQRLGIQFIREHQPNGYWHVVRTSRETIASIDRLSEDDGLQVLKESPFAQKLFVPSYEQKL